MEQTDRRTPYRFVDPATNGGNNIQLLTRDVSVDKTTNRRRWGHWDVWVAVSVIKHFQFVCESDVHVTTDVVR